MDDSLATLLTSTLAEVDQLGAEMKDPDTAADRREEILKQLTWLYKELQKYERN